MTYTLPKLPYEYDALEPFIDAKTMEIHHLKHHAAYINNLNNALLTHPELNLGLEAMLKDPSLIPSDIRTTVINNGGGHFNHSLFFNILKKNDNHRPTGELLTLINQAFGSFDEFVEKFKSAALTRFGSGWAWLVLTPEKRLTIVSTPNQDTPLYLGQPILGLDVWEHAYYLNYQNRRNDYISAFFQVINWPYVEKLLNSALTK